VFVNNLTSICFDIFHWVFLLPYLFHFLINTYQLISVFFATCWVNDSRKSVCVCVRERERERDNPIKIKTTQESRNASLISSKNKDFVSFPSFLRIFWSQFIIRGIASMPARRVVLSGDHPSSKKFWNFRIFEALIKRLIDLIIIVRILEILRFLNLINW
jgi:hypothetical protein